MISTAGIDTFDPTFMVNDGSGLLSDFNATESSFATAANNDGFMPAPTPDYGQIHLPWMNPAGSDNYQENEFASFSPFNQFNGTANGTQLLNPAAYPGAFSGNFDPNLSMTMNPAPQSAFHQTFNMPTMQPAPAVQVNIQSVFRNQKHQCLWSAGCTKSFTRMGDLERHWISVHLGQKHHCTWFGCSDNQGKGFCRLEKLRKHQKDCRGFALV